MGMPSEIWLVRHGETEWSRSGQHTSRTDLPLTPAGERQAENLKRMLAGHSFALVLSSPMKRAIETTMEAGARGIKIQLAGRLGGAEMARCEKAAAGSIPLSTLRAKIDYGFTEASTPQGNIGVQVWVNQGMYQEEPNDGADAQEGQAPKKPKRTYKR